MKRIFISAAVYSFFARQFSNTASTANVAFAQEQAFFKKKNDIPNTATIKLIDTLKIAEYFNNNESLLSMPAARRLAAENHADLSLVRPTGYKGRIAKWDVQRFIEGCYKSEMDGKSGTIIFHAASSSKVTCGVPATAAATTAGRRSPRPDQKVPIHGVMKAMVKVMTQANGIPTFSTCDDIEMNALIEARAYLKPAFTERSGGKVSLSYLPFFIKAASMALIQFPDINAHTNSDCTELIIKARHNIGFAMDSIAGLIVPNIKDVQNKSLYQIAEDLAHILEKGKQGHVSNEDLKEGTFTLSNIGSVGANYSQPVIFPPQVAIGALGKMVKQPRFDGKGNVYPCSFINISFSADHRVVDGAKMVRFSNLFKHYVENPITMLVDLK